MRYGDYFRLLRPQQWYKNLLVFLPLIFAGKALNATLVWAVLLGFVSLCLASSFNYIVNDIIDRGKDHAHPEKRNRPVASGRISVWVAGIIAVVVLGVGLRLAWVLEKDFFMAAVFLVALTQLYSLFLKRVAFADILVIGVNFVTRAVAGAFIIDVVISPWLILCTFFFALFLASGKRHADLAFLKDKAVEHKETLKFYTREVTNALMLIATTLLIAMYSAYSLLSEHHGLAFSLPFALFVIFRYFSHIYAGSPVARHPELVFKDWQMVVGMALWGVSVIAALYLVP